MPFRNLSLGAKLNIALLGFLLALAAATSATIVYGFSRTQDNATRRSNQALEEQGKLALKALVGGVSDSGGVQFEVVAELSQRSARYLGAAEPAPGDVLDSVRFQRTDAGIYYDASPNRVSDFVVLNGGSPDDPVIVDDLDFSASLNPVFPLLLESFAGEAGGQNLDPIAMVFVSKNGAARYYPPRGIQQYLPPNVDLATRMEQLGPGENPDRRTIWTPLYEDAAGQGPIVTARTPVYDGDVFRGTLEVDLSVDKLIAQINLIKPTPSAFSFYVGSTGTLWKSDAYDLLTRESPNNPDLASVLKAMEVNTSESGVTVLKVALDGRDYYFAYEWLPSIGGSFGVAGPVDEVTAQAASITAGIGDEGNRTLLIVLGAMAGLFAAGLVGATWLNRRLLVAPLQQLVAATRAVAAGDLATQVTLDRGDELGTLGRSFNTMTADLRQRRDALAQEMREREATQEELRALLAAMTDVVMVFDRDGRCLRIAPTNPDLLYVPAEDAVGRRLHDLMPPEEADAFVAAIRAALDKREANTIEYPMDIAGRSLWFAATISPMSSDTVVYVARDITERVNASQLLERQVEERTRELDALLRADHELFQSLDLGEVLQALVDVAVDVIGADKSVVTIWDRERGSVSIGASRNMSPDGLREFSAMLPVGIELPDDVEANIFESPDELAMRPEFRRLIESEGIQASMDLPIRSPSGLVIGGYGVGYSRPHTFDEAEHRLLSALAERAAVAISNAELYARAQQAASLEERQRLARELHDSVSQALYGIALGARTARELLDREPAKAVEPIDYVLSLSQAGLAEMRALIFELRPESLATEGLVVALEKQVAATQARFGLQIELDLCEEPTIPIETKEALYRVAQEALHNVVKHAKAQHASLSLRQVNGALQLEIQDDGVGFDTEADYAGHLGLRSMRERVERQRGEIRIESERGTGSQIIVRVPV